jgi:beta-lactam-binding protein with PASTA domain
VELKELAHRADPARVAHAILDGDAGAPHVQEIALSGKVGADQIRLPDLTGVPMRSAMRQVIELGVVPELSGTGLLVEQVPAPGTIVDKGSKVELRFKPAT